jgi:hypothetical protein
MAEPQAARVRNARQLGHDGHVPRHGKEDIAAAMQVEDRPATRRASRGDPEGRDAARVDRGDVHSRRDYEGRRSLSRAQGRDVLWRQRRFRRPAAGRQAGDKGLMGRAGHDALRRRPAPAFGPPRSA